MRAIYKYLIWNIIAIFLVTSLTGCYSEPEGYTTNTSNLRELKTIPRQSTTEEVRQEKTTSFPQNDWYNQPICGVTKMLTIDEMECNAMIRQHNNGDSLLVAKAAIPSYYVIDDPEEQNCLIVQFDILNVSNRPIAWGYEWKIQAFQDGIELNEAFAFSLYRDGYESKRKISTMTRQRLEFYMIFEVRDWNTPVVIQVKELMSDTLPMQISYDLQKIRKFWEKKREEVRVLSNTEEQSQDPVNENTDQEEITYHSMGNTSDTEREEYSYDWLDVGDDRYDYDTDNHENDEYDDYDSDNDDSYEDSEEEYNDDEYEYSDDYEEETEEDENDGYDEYDEYDEYEYDNEEE